MRTLYRSIGVTLFYGVTYSSIRKGGPINLGRRKTWSKEKDPSLRLAVGAARKAVGIMFVASTKYSFVSVRRENKLEILAV